MKREGFIDPFAGRQSNIPLNMQTFLLRFFKEIGADYSLKNFEFAVLETFGFGTNDQTIINRENWWKETLHTRQELNRK